MDKETIFNITTPLGISIRTTKSHWEFISEYKHPILKNRIDDIILTLSSPDEIRKSKSDKTVMLFYKSISENRFICCVIKDENSLSGFLITAYLTGAIKEGENVWKK